MLAQSASRTPDRLAVVDDYGSRTYGALAATAEGLRGTLRELGVRRGARVLVCLPNDATFLVGHFAVLAEQAVSVPVDILAASRTMQMIAKLAGAEFAIVSDSLSWSASEALAAAGVSRVIKLSPSSEWTVSVDSGRPRSPRQSSPADLACLMFTTGSTSVPKGVPLRHENILAAIHHVTNFLGYSADDREVVMLPLSHSFGLGHVYCNLRVGGAVRLCAGMAKVGRVLRAVREFGATGFPGTPLSYGLLLDHYIDAFRQSCSSLRFIVVDSAALPVDRAKQLMDVLPRTELVVYYGLTEASRSTMVKLRSVSEHRLHTVGRAMSGIDLRVQDVDGRELQAGQQGEVTIAGPTVPGRYWGNSDEAMSGYRDGRLLTGDLGYVDDEGYLFLTGRLKDQINLGGTKIAPGEVEQVLRSIVGVRDVAVLGLSSATGDETEVVVACVVVEPNSGLSRESLCECCRQSLEFHKVPSEFYAVSAIPRAVTGKLLRPELRALALSRRFGEFE